MHLWTHNNDFDILRSVHYWAKLQIAKFLKNAQKIKCYMHKASLEFEFSYKLVLAKSLQFLLVNLHPISPFPMNRYRTGYILSSHV